MASSYRRIIHDSRNGLTEWKIIGTDPSGEDILAPVMALESGSISSGLTDAQLRAAAVAMVGNVAAGATDSGNPVKVGGVYNSTKPTLTTGQRGDAQLTSRGATMVTLFPTDSATAVATPTPTDGLANNIAPLATGGYNYLFNGTTWDRIRGDITNGLDVDVTRFPNAATATLASVNDSASSVTLRAANSTRKGCIIFNDSDQILYIAFGATASLTSFTAKIAPGGYWEMPISIYTGAISGIWAVDSTGAAHITEW